MGFIRLLLVVAQLIQPTNLADNSLKARIWKTQQHWCISQHYSCRYKPDKTMYPLDYQCGSQQGAVAVNNGIQEDNKSSSIALTDGADHNSTKQVNQSPPAAMTNYAACCGFCSCEDDCAEYGSCCLPEYRSLEYGRKISKTAAAKYGFISFLVKLFRVDKSYCSLRFDFVLFRQ